MKVNKQLFCLERAWSSVGKKKAGNSNRVPKKKLESPLDCKEIKPVNPKGNQPLIFNGGTVGE